MTAAATRLGVRAGAFGPWLLRTGYALCPILVVGGLAFVIDSGALSAVLTLSLLMLLAWVAAVCAVATRSDQPRSARARGLSPQRAEPGSGSRATTGCVYC